jgi:WD40 repeat protein
VACALLTLLAGARGGTLAQKEGRAEGPRRDAYGDRLPEGARVRMGTARWRLEGRSRALGFTPDGKGLLVEPEEALPGGLRILEIPSGKEVWRLAGAQGRYQVSHGIVPCTFGNTMVLPRGTAVEVWDMAARRLVRQFQVDQNYPCVLALSPDGKVVATGHHNYEKGKNAAIRLWEVATGRPLGALEGHPTSIQALMFSADGKRLFSGSGEARYALQKGGVEVIPGWVRVWDLTTRKQVSQYPNESYGTLFAPGGRVWAYQGRDNRIHLAETAEGKEVAQIPLQGSSFAFTPDGKALVTAGYDQPIRLWDAATGKELRRLEGHLKGYHATLLFAPDGKTLACVSPFTWHMAGGMVRLWDLASGKEIRPYTTHQDHVDCVACSPDGRTVASGGRDGSLFLWGAATGKLLHRLADHEGGVTAVAFARDGRALASAGKDGVVRLWGVADGKETRQLDGGGDEVVALRFAADGKSVWACRRQGKVQGWEVPTGRGLAGFDCKEKSLHTAAFSPDGDLLAYVAGFRGEFSGASTVHVCRVPSGKELLALELRERLAGADGMRFVALHCWEVAFSPDSRFLATSESIQTQGLRVILGNHTLRVWELTTGQPVLKVTGLAVPTRRLAFSPDGRRLAHGHGQPRGFGQGDEQVMFLRDISAGEDLQQVVNDKHEVISQQTGERLRPMKGHVGSVSSVTFSPDGKTLLTGGGDGTLLGWAPADFAPAALARPTKISAKELEVLWDRLAAPAAGPAYQAIDRLEAAPAQAVPFLKERLKPAPGADPKRVAQLIANLEDRSFALRQKSFNELATYAEQAEEALRAALPKSRSLEAQRRMQQLLDRLDRKGLSPEYRRALRALVALERIGSAEARRVVETLASGAPTRLTREARASLEHRFPKRGE